MIPDVPPRLPAHLRAGTPRHDDGVNAGALRQGLIHIRLQGGQPPAAQALIGGHHGLTIGIQYALLQRLRREAAEHHRMDRAYAGACQHGDGGLRRHGHVDGDPVAFFNAPGLQRIGAPADLVEQLPVGDGFIHGRVVPFPEDRRLVALGLQVSIQAVVAGVQPPANEPLDGDLAGGLPIVPVLHLVPFPEPAEIAPGMFRPEPVGVLQGAGPQGPVAFIVNARGRRQRRRHGIDLGLGHEPPPSDSGNRKGKGL